MNVPEAFWISPVGEFFPLPHDTFHIDMVETIPERFGLTIEYIRQIEIQTNSSISEGTLARDTIVTELFRKGWLRIRVYKNSWTIQTSRTHSEYIGPQLANWLEDLFVQSRKSDKIRIIDECAETVPYEYQSIEKALKHFLENRGEQNGII